MKTKTLVAFIIGMMIALFATNSLNAQTVPTTGGDNGGGGSGGGTIIPIPAVPDRLPIGDVAELQAYAWEQVANISMYSWASSAIRSTTNVKSDVWIPYKTKVDGALDVGEIFGIIKAQSLVLSVLYPSDRIQLGAGLYDNDGNNLFYSYESSDISPPQNGISKNVLDVMFNMSSEIWIPIGAASWFRIVERDADGNDIRYYSSREYDVRNGKIRFPAYFAKKGGELIVSLRDGTEVAYSLNGGKRIVPTTVKIGVGSVSSVGTRTFRIDHTTQGCGSGPFSTITGELCPNNVFVAVSSEESERNINPLSQLVYTGSEEVNFAAWRLVSDNGETASSEKASAVKIWHQGQSPSTALGVGIGSPNSYVSVPLEAGRYWVKFEFASGWPTGNQFYPPYQYDDGGKGAEVVPVLVEEK